MNGQHAGILAASVLLPDKEVSVEEVFASEGLAYDAGLAFKLGVRSVRVFEVESPTGPAVDVSRLALEKAGLAPTDLDAIIDFSVMPQRYVEPAWSMSNELQAELGAKRAFTLGFSGGAAANLLVALRFAAAMIETDPAVRTILLAASDCAIPGNRLINRDDPDMLIGDAASAIILSRDAPRATILGTEIVTDPALEDVLMIPGGGMAHPTRVDLYRLRLDREKYMSRDRFGVLADVTDDVLSRNGLSRTGVRHFIGPNISRADMELFAHEIGGEERAGLDSLARLGHLHSNDLVLNFIDLESRGIEAGDHVLLAAHGMGFTQAATLIRY